jgi:hypothetical protein
MLKIQVTEPDMTQPIKTPIPSGNASRWNSPYDDDDGLEPLVSVFVSQPAYAAALVSDSNV